MKLLRDTWLVFARYWELFVGNPVWVAVGVIQPLMYLVLFAPLLEQMTNVPGFPPGGAYNVFVPGLLIQLGLFGASGVGFGLIAELRAGVIERMRVTPVSRVAMLFGRALRDIVVLLIQAVLIIVLSVPFGLHVDLSGTLVALGLVALIGLGIASICYAVALGVASEDAYAPIVFTASLPLLLLSGVLLPLTFAPAWLRTVAAFNPLSYAVDAARAVFNNQVGDPSVLRGLVIMAVLAVAGVALGTRSFSRAAS
jgi:ABC-2 type transport system permease protein